MRRIHGLWLAALLVAPVILPARAVPEKSLAAGPWSVILGEGVRLVSGETPVAQIVAYEFAVTNADDLADGVRLHGRWHETPMTASYRLSEGRLTCRYEPAAGAPRAEFPLLITFNAGDLAGADVEVDGRTIRIPVQRAAHDLAAGREFVLFRDHPAKTLRLAFGAMGFASLRDFRGDGRSDFQVLAVPDASGVLEVVVDCTLATANRAGERYEGERLVAQDDLHLVDLTRCRNQIQNPGFEAGLALWSWGVTDVRVAPGREHGWRADGSGGRSGRRSARYTVARGFNAPMLCAMPVFVRPGRTYTFSFYARTDRPGAALSAFIQTAVWPDFPADGGRRVALTAEWQRYELTFVAPNTIARLCLGDRWWDDGGDDQIDGAHIWLDDVQLEEGTQAGAFVQKPVVAYASTGYPFDAIPLDATNRGVNVTLVNTTPDRARGRVEVAVQDLARRTLRRATVEEELPGWGKTVRAVDLGGLTERGLLRVEMRARAGDFTETFYGRVALFRPLPDRGRLCYAYHMEPTLERARLLQRFGVNGSLSFRIPEDPARNRELEAIGWTHVFTPVEGQDCPVKLFHQEMQEADWQAFDRWLAARIQRYPDQRYWKTMNEPNCGGYRWTPADHVRAVSMVRRHAKAINPAARILTPDPYNASRNGQAWMEAFLQAGGSNLVDVLAIHTYRARPEAPDLDQDIQSLIRLKARYGLADAPIMFTEGEATARYQLGDLGVSPFQGWADWRLNLLSLDVGRAEIAAAALMTRTLLACLKNGDAVTYYLSWADDVVDEHPLVSLAALNWLFERLRHAEFLREYTIGNETKTYLFAAPDGVPMAVLWSYDLKVDRGENAPGEVQIPLPAEGELEFHDLMGNRLTPRVADGYACVELSGRPVYVTGRGVPVEPFAALLERARVDGQSLRAVDLTLRMAAPAAATLTVANRLTRPVSGTLEVCVEGTVALPNAVTLDRQQTVALPLALPAAGATFSASPIAMAFHGMDGAGDMRREELLRWFSIGPLTNAVTIDGDGADWAGVPALALNRAADVVTYAQGAGWRGERDLSATCRFGYRADGLYACIAVQDDVFSQDNPIETSWRGDALQLYIDLMADGHDRPGTGYDSNDETILVAKAGGRDLMFRDYTPEWQIAFVKPGVLATGECAVARQGTTTTYEFRLPPREVFPLRLEPGTTFGLGLLVNDADLDGTRRQGLSNAGGDAEPHARPERWPAAILSGPPPKPISSTSGIPLH